MNYKDIISDIKNRNLKNAYIYDSVEELIDDLKNKIKKGDAILVKASRSMKFERIVNALNKE